MICAWIETSSADTGSSAMISFGAQRERPGDPDSLPLSAGELVRVAVVVLGAQSDSLEELADLALQFLARGEPVKPQRVADDLSDAVARIQRGVGVLEDDLHLTAQRTASRAASSRPSPCPRSAPSPRSAQ